MVGVDAKLGSLQVAAPCAKSMDHCQQLQLVYGVVALSGVELARLVGDGLKSIALVLKQRGADGKLGGVCVELEGVGEVRCRQDRCGCQSLLEVSKGFGLHLAPSPSRLGAGDVGQWRCYVGEVVDEAPVEAREAQEAPELGGRLRVQAIQGWPSPSLRPP